MKTKLEPIVIFKGFNFTAGILAYALQKQGHRVGIYLNQPLKSNYKPELGLFYPKQLSKAHMASKNYRFLLKCSTLFPNLYFPNRILFFPESQKVNSSYYLSMDKLIGRERENSTLLISTSKYANYKGLSKTFPKAALLYEFSFDRSQAIINLYNKCMNAGASKVHSIENEGKLIIDCFDYDSNTIIDLTHSNKIYPNSIQIQHSNFNFLLYQSSLVNSVQITNLNSIDFAQFKNEAISLLKTFNIEIDDTKLRACYNANQAIESSKTEIFDVSLLEQRNYIQHKQKELAKLLGIPINVDAIFGDIKDDGMTHSNFRIIQNECDEKFDLAKQTGIEYSLFHHLFYRYRNHIDQFIEDAYEIMNIERNPTLIWDKVLSNYISS